MTSDIDLSQGLTHPGGPAYSLGLLFLWEKELSEGVFSSMYFPVF